MIKMCTIEDSCKLQEISYETFNEVNTNDAQSEEMGDEEQMDFIMTKTLI